MFEQAILLESTDEFFFGTAFDTTAGMSVMSRPNDRNDEEFGHKSEPSDTLR